MFDPAVSALVLLIRCTGSIQFHNLRLTFHRLKLPLHHLQLSPHQYYSLLQNDKHVRVIVVHSAYVMLCSKYHLLRQYAVDDYALPGTVCLCLG